MTSTFVKPILHTKSLTQYYKDAVVIDRVNLELFPGEIHALVGNHGEGKTLLCRVLAKQVENDHGVIHIEQVRGRESIEVVWNIPAVYEQLTVGENLVLGTQKGLGKYFTTEKIMIRKAQKWLDSIGVDLPVTEAVYKLSTNDKIVLGILRMMYRNPRILILDQALEGLAPKSIKKMTALLRDYADKGNAILWVTHKLEIVNWLADRLSIFRRGKIIFSEVTSGLVRNNLIELCYSHLNENFEGTSVEDTDFHNMLFYMDTMLQKLPIPIIMLDDDDIVVYFNQAAVTFLHEEFRGEKAFATVFAGAGQERILDLLDEHKELKKNVATCIPFKINKQSYMLNVRIGYISDDSMHDGRVVIIEDITEQESIREKANLSANLSSLGMLAAGVSHEINNPLSIIENYASFLLSEVSGEDSTQAITQIREEVQEIHRITNNLKAFSGSENTVCEVFDLRDSVNQLVNLLRFEVKKHNIRIVWENPDEEILVDASRAEIRQVLLNLINNSFEALRNIRDAYVKVSIEVVDNSILLVVEDNGPGIPFENPSDIFLPFNSSKKSTGSNHGLGLSIVYNIIQGRNGSISVENIKFSGCRFTISLPEYKSE